MSDTEIFDLLDDLDGQIASLKTLLKPLTARGAAQEVQKLPVLDQAKANVLVAYASHTMIFNAVKLSGKDPRQHPVFAELARTRRYFEKIKEAEEQGGAEAAGSAGAQDGPRARVDTAVAGRFIKAGLEGNDRLDRERAQKKQEQEHKGIWQGSKTKLDDVDMAEGSEKEQEQEASTAEHEESKTERKARRKAERRKRKAEEADLEAADEDDAGEGGIRDATQKLRLDETSSPAPVSQPSIAPGVHTSKAKPSKSKRKKSSKAPRGSSEVMQDLLTKANKKAKDKANGKGEKG